MQTPSLLELARKASGLNQTDVAVLLSITSQTYSKVEKEKPYDLDVIETLLPVMNNTSRGLLKNGLLEKVEDIFLPYELKINQLSREVDYLVAQEERV